MHAAGPYVSSVVPNNFRALHDSAVRSRARARKQLRGEAKSGLSFFFFLKESEVRSLPRPRHDNSNSHLDRRHATSVYVEQTVVWKRAFFPSTVPRNERTGRQGSRSRSRAGRRESDKASSILFPSSSVSTSTTRSIIGRRRPGRIPHFPGQGRAGRIAKCTH